MKYVLVVVVGRREAHSSVRFFAFVLGVPLSPIAYERKARREAYVAVSWCCCWGVGWGGIKKN